MAMFEQWRPTIRIEPCVQLEYRNPLLKRTEYRECENPVSNQGPAAEKGVNPEETV